MPDGFPHFVGTIDAFLLRYVVRRFGEKLVRLDRFTHPLPDRDYSLQAESCEMNNGKRDRLSAFRIDADAFGARVDHVGRGGVVTPVPTSFAKAIIDAKKQAWQAGELTYSDVVAVSWSILHSKDIARVVARRFPRILVDEFQDTTGVRERCLRFLLQSDSFERGFVVGDPDQCIMAFAGAKASLFDDFERMAGAKSLSFSECYRFHDRIAAVTAPLRQAKAPVSAKAVKTERSATILLTHDFTVRPKDEAVSAVTARFAELCQSYGHAVDASIVLTWTDADVQRLGGLARKHMPLSGGSFAQVMGAIRARSRGEIFDAFRRIERLLGQLVFKHSSTPTEEELLVCSLTLRQWRAAVLRTLDAVSAQFDAETVGAWATRIKQIFERERATLTGTFEKLGAKFRLDVEGGKKLKKSQVEKLLQSLATEYLPTTHSAATSPISNIHQVKGEEYPAVCVYLPLQDKASPPAQPILAKNDDVEDALEARRVVYVGLTRAEHLLVVALPESWIAALEGCEDGRQFLGGFDVRLGLSRTL